MSLSLSAPAAQAAADETTAAEAGAVAAAGTTPAKVRHDTPSRLPVPRFAALKAPKTFCRIGPSFEHPVRVTFLRKGLPVIIVAETRDHWRKIQDRDGDTCWTHKSKLSGVDTGLIAAGGATLLARPTEAAPVTAELGPGVIVAIEKSRGPWRRVVVGRMRGWTKAEHVWGAGAAEAAVRRD
ncbi:MAG: SH3 domain-containing protein [Pseudomonadota bacterium]